MCSEKESTAAPEYGFEHEFGLNHGHNKPCCCRVFMFNFNEFLPHKSVFTHETIGEAKFCFNKITSFFTTHNNEEEIQPLLKEIEQKMKLNGYNECCINETAYKPNGIYNDKLYDFIALNNYKIKIINKSVGNRRYQWCKNLNTTE